MTKENKNVKKFPNSGNIPKLRFSEFTEEWEVKKLGEICKMQAGKFVSASEILKETDDKLYPCYGANGLRGFTYSYNYEGEYSLIGRQGALCGNVTRVNDKFYATEHAVVVTPKDNVHSVWLFYLLNYLNLNQYATGMAQPGLSVHNLLEVESIMANSIDEQYKTASLLTLIDTRILTQRKIISQLKSQMSNLKDLIFEQKLRFTDDKENEFPDWQESKLEDICEKQSSSISANKIEDNIGDYPIYGATGILKNIDFYEVENDYISIIKDGAGVGRLLYCEGKSSVLGTLDIIQSKNVKLYFIFLLLSRIDFKKYITGSTIPHIYFKDYKKEKFQIPSIEEQEKIANFFKSLDDKINLENDLLIQFENQKKYLLQNLFV
ncbi:restriction endonuclease subunit S [Elizabethkingia occulta]|uniref:restriction endonuclease subunit S n=2 Tax=Elizabethkingia occulta TaxID=1867263 RepID=UPI00398C3E9E